MMDDGGQTEEESCLIGGGGWMKRLSVEGKKNWIELQGFP